MLLCDDGHEEICYVGGSCPLCEMVNERDQLKGKLIDTESECSELDAENNELKDEVEGLKEKLEEKDK